MSLLAPPMKRSLIRFRRSHPASFTLVELLVVMAIIAILAAVILRVGVQAINAAKRAKMQSLAVQIQTACMAYYTEYGIYPVPTSPAPVAATDYLIADTGSGTDATAWKGLIYGLSGGVNPYDGSKTAPPGATPNLRGISFITLKSSDVGSTGYPLNTLASGTSISFNIMIDYDYDNVIGDSCPGNKVLNFQTSTTGTINYFTTGTGGPVGGVAVWANCNGSTSGKNPAYWVHTY